MVRNCLGSFNPSSHLALPGPEEVLDVDVRVQSRQVGVSVPGDQKISIMIFQIRLTLYVWHQVCPFTNLTCISFIENGPNFFLLLIFSYFLTLELAQ